MELQIATTTYVTLTGLADSAGVPQNAATVTAAVTDPAGTQVGGTVALAYVALSAGNYSGIIPAATMSLLKRDTTYSVTVTALVGSVQLQKVETLLAVYGS